MSAIFSGLRGTGQFDTDHRPTNYRETYTLLEPNGDAPLNALLAMTGSEVTDDPTYKNFRDELPDRTFTSGAVADANSPISGANGEGLSFIIAGSMLVNISTGEVMHATAKNAGGTVAVTRNIGGTTHQIADGDEIIIAGFAAKEGADTPDSVSFDANVSENYTQIFRTPFGVTNTLDKTKLRTGSKLEEVATKALKLHMSDIERAMFFGQKHIQDANTNEPTRFTGGLLNSLSNQIDVASGYATANELTEDEFDRMLIEQVFAYGSTNKVAFVGAKVAGHIQKLGKKRWSPQTMQGTYGVNLTRYETFAGSLDIHLHPQFRQIRGMEDAMVIVDFPDLKYRHMPDRDTQVLKDRQGNGSDKVVHEYLTECGLELTQDKTHTVIRNWKSVA